ncbi:MAG: lipopolysaccharide biosynthesis protein [Actinomycetes bacterium]
MTDATPRRDADLTRRTLGGLRWSYAQTAVASVLQLGMAAVLARLLTPEAFGLVALGDLSLRLVNYLARGGVTQALIQKPDLRDVDVRAGWTLSVGLGVLFSLVLAAGAPLAGLVFDTPEVVGVVRWMGLGMLLFSLGATAEALLRRDLDFRSIALRDIVSYVVGYPVVGLALALAGAGVWSLVAATLTQTGVRSLLAYLPVRHGLRPTGDREALGAVFSFGGRVSVISLLEFLGSELDTFVVGRVAGAGPLGVYNRAYLLARLPTYQITTSLSKVLFPAFSAVQHDLVRFRSALLTALRVTAAIVVPMSAGMAVAAPELVLVLLGEQWTGAIPVLPFVAVSSAVSMLTHFTAVSAEARAFLGAKVRISALRAALLAVFLAVAAGGPLWGYGAALLGAATSSHVAYLVLMRRVVEVRVRDLVWVYVPAVVAGLVVAAVLAGVRLGTVDVLPVALVLLLEVAAGGLSLALMLRFGPLTGARTDVATRLANAGALHGDGRAARLARGVLGAGVAPSRRP